MTLTNLTCLDENSPEEAIGKWVNYNGCCGCIQQFKYIHNSLKFKILWMNQLDSMKKWFRPNEIHKMVQKTIKKRKPSWEYVEKTDDTDEEVKRPCKKPKTSKCEGKINQGIYLIEEIVYKQYEDDPTQVLMMKIGKNETRTLDQRLSDYNNGGTNYNEIKRWSVKGKKKRAEIEQKIIQMVKKRGWDVVGRSSGEWIKPEIKPEYIVEEIEKILRCN